MGAEQSTEAGAPEGAPAPAGAGPDAPPPATSGDATGSAIGPGSAGLPSLAELEEMDAAGVIEALKNIAAGKNSNDHETATACCKRLRVLCRDTAGRQDCERLNAAAVMISAIDALEPLNEMLALQALAALVNICAERDVDSLRDLAVNAGALRVAVRAIDEHCHTNMQVSEMSCLLVRNLCCGKDDNVLERRKQAANAGVIEASIKAMGVYENEPIAQNIIIALRLVVDRLPELRTRATNAGAKADWVKPVTKDGGGSFLSFRGGFGTNRSAKAAKTPPKMMQTSTLGGIQEE